MDSLKREGNKKTIERSKRTKRRLVTVVSACVSDVFLNGFSFLFCGRNEEEKNHLKLGRSIAWEAAKVCCCAATASGRGGNT